jgi:hypothetical protein
MRGLRALWAAVAVVAGFGAAGLCAASAQGQVRQLPQYGQDAHLGVLSCAGSTCHGAVEPWKNSTVLQNEYVTWQRQDKHAKAYNVLLDERSKRIARNLGLSQPAHQSAICLDCHADNAAARSKTFQLSDGVGCEACHGGAPRWLGIHVSGQASHSDNVANGMYPIEDPVARAELCLSCHFGDRQKFVTHRIMGAGHPRMSFELDTFTAVQPAHYRIDDDYRKRKNVANPVQTWAIGQAMAMSKLMEAMADPKRNRDGIFPEFVLFDCHACHHPMSNLRWQPRASTGLGPGVPRVNDSNIIMLHVITAQIDPETAKALRSRALALHHASTEGSEAMVTAAKALKEVADKLVVAFAKHNFGRSDMEALMNGLISEGLAGEYVDYAAAEQTTMAMSAIISAMQQSGLANEAQVKTMNAALEKLYTAVAKDEEYKPKTFVAALQDFQAAAPKF